MHTVPRKKKRIIPSDSLAKIFEEIAHKHDKGDDTGHMPVTIAELCIQSTKTQLLIIMTKLLSSVMQYLTEGL